MRSTQISHAKCWLICAFTVGRHSARKRRSRAATSAVILPWPRLKRLPSTCTAGAPFTSNHGFQVDGSGEQLEVAEHAVVELNCCSELKRVAGLTPAAAGRLVPGSGLGRAIDSFPLNQPSTLGATSGSPHLSIVPPQGSSFGETCGRRPRRLSSVLKLTREPLRRM